MNEKPEAERWSMGEPHPNPLGDWVPYENYERLKAENEALRRDAEQYRRLLKWLIVTGLLSRERCRIDSPASYGDWWVLRKPHGVGVLVLGYGQTEDAAIDAAMEDKT